MTGRAPTARGRTRTLPLLLQGTVLRAHRAGIATTALATLLVAGAIALSLAPGGWAYGGAATVAAHATDARLAWWQLAVMFGVASVFVAHVEVNAESHTFSFSEVPLVLGLLFAVPGDLVAGRLVGEALVLAVYARQAPGKLAFNLSVFLAETTLATEIVARVGPADGHLDATVCAAVFLAAAGAGQLGATAVWAVIRLHDGRMRLATLMLVAAVTTAGNASLAVVAAVVTAAMPWALGPLLVVCAVMLAAYRGYARLSRRYGGLRSLYEFTTTTSGTARRQQTAVQVLTEARRLMRAGISMALLPRITDDGGGVETDPSDQGVGSRDDADAAQWVLTTVSATPATATDDGPTAAVRPPTALPAWLRDHVLAGNTLLIPHGTRNPSHLATLAHLGVADLIAAPMASGDDVTGILVVADRIGDVSTFDTDDALMLATLASQAAVAMQNAGLIEQLHGQIQAREHEALHDALTGLPNRTLFLRSLDSTLAEPVDPRATVLLMDLNGFKEVNDTLGHHTGDRLLEQVADRLRHAAPAGATVARLGGDEFALVVPGLGHVDEGLATAEDLNATLREPFTLDGLTLEVGASIGVAVAPEHAADATTLLQRADVAMYAAKAAHLSASVYSPDADWHTHDRLRLAHELRRTIETGRVTVVYQPIARVGDGRVTDVEALARWHHPELGAISPETFIAVAERTGLIHDLTWSVLDQVLAQARIWRSTGIDLGVNVNLSVLLLRDKDLPRKITDALQRHRLPPAALSLEVTETGIMTDPARMTRTLEDLVATGVAIAIDDFGTGHSSLAYLQRLPVSKVKIDKSFVMPMAADLNARTIVKSVIELAHNLDMEAVAEGVEDLRTLDHLSALGCDHIQGYYLSRPIPAVEITEWLAGRDAAAASTRTLRAVRTAN